MIAKRRALIGEPSQMAVYAAQILEAPPDPKLQIKGKRVRARSAIDTRFATNSSSQSNLCMNLNDSIYLEELLELAKDLELPVTKFSSKNDIFLMLMRYVSEIETTYSIQNTDNECPAIAERRLRRALHRGTPICAGGRHSLVLRRNGTIRSWGSNGNNQLLLPTLKGNQECVAISAGHLHSLVLLNDGSVIACGNNEYHQCTVPNKINGNPPPKIIGSETELLLPTLKGNQECVAISAGKRHSMALLNDGSVIAWGNNQFNQSGVPKIMDVTLKTNQEFVAISAGHLHSLALRTDGSVAAWGDNGFDQCEVPNIINGVWLEGHKKCVAISAGGHHSLALLNDGSVIAWGWNLHNRCEVPDIINGTSTLEGNQKCVAISAGQRHSLALLDDGSVIAWGDNEFKQCEVPDKINRTSTLEGNQKCVAISAGYFHSLALLEDGSVIAWGDNEFMQCEQFCTGIWSLWYAYENDPIYS